MKKKRVKNSPIVQLLIVVLLLSLVFSGGLISINNENVVASVGGQDITIQEVNQEYKRYAQGNEDSSTQRYIKGLILNNLVERKLLDLERQSLGLDVSDKTLLPTIQEIDEFKDKNGKFNLKKYKKVLKQSNLSEATLLNNVRGYVLNKLLMDSILSLKIASDKEAELLYVYDHQQKKFDVAKIPFDVVDDILVSDAEVKQYYQDNIGQYQTKEKRNLTYFTVKCNDFFDDVKVSEDTLKQVYDERKMLGEYRKPKQYDITSIVFKDQNDAEQFAEKLNSKDFLDLILEYDKDVKRNVLVADDDAIYGDYLPSQQGQYSKVFHIDGLGYRMIYLNNIVESREFSFVEVKSKLENELVTERSCELADQLANEIKDEISGGNDLNTILATRKKFVTQDVTVDEGNLFDEQYKILPDITTEESGLLLSNIFTRKSGDLVFGNLHDGGHVFINISSIEPSVSMSLETIFTDVKQELLNKRSIEASKQLATEWLEKVKNSNDINVLEQQDKVKIVELLLSNQAIEYSNLVDDQYVEEIVARSKPSFYDKLYTNSKKKEFLIIRLAEIIDPDRIDKAGISKQKKLLEDSWQNILYRSYIDYLQKKYKVNINSKLI